MAIEIQYGNGVVVLPARAAEVAQNAERSDLGVLLALLSDASLCAGYGQKGGVEAIAAASGYTVDEVSAAVAFWRGAGVLTLTEGKTPAATQKRQSAAPAKPEGAPADRDNASKAAAPDGAALLKKSDDLPKYTMAELGNLLEQRSEIAELLTECQNLFGKLFTAHELNIMLGLTDYLGLSCEYVLLLATHFCTWSKENETRPSVRGLEKLAIAMYDRDIVEIKALQAELVRQEQVRSLEGKLRKLFGIGARALTTKEKKAFSDWVHAYQYDMEMITLAFEAGADATTDVTVPYVNSILKRWNTEGIRTPADVQASKQANESAREKAKTGTQGKAAQNAGSFDTDDFYEAAMRKSLGDNYDKIMQDKEGM